MVSSKYKKFENGKKKIPIYFYVYWNSPLLYIIRLEDPPSTLTNLHINKEKAVLKFCVHKQLIF